MGWRFSLRICVSMSNKLKCAGGCGRLAVFTCRHVGDDGKGCDSPLCGECSDGGFTFCPKCEAALVDAGDDADDSFAPDDDDDNDNDDDDNDVYECPTCGGDINDDDCMCGDDGGVE